MFHHLLIERSTLPYMQWKYLFFIYMEVIHQMFEMECVMTICLTFWVHMLAIIWLYSRKTHNIKVYFLLIYTLKLQNVKNTKMREKYIWRILEVICSLLQSKVVLQNKKYEISLYLITTLPKSMFAYTNNTRQLINYNRSL